MIVEPAKTEDGLYETGTNRCQNDLLVLRGSSDRLIAYFRIDPQLTSYNCTDYLIVEYIDSGTGHFFFEYYSTFNDIHSSKSVFRTQNIRLGNSGIQKKTCINISNGNWSGQFNQCDFRINIIDNEIDHFCIKHISVQEHPSDDINLIDLPFSVRETTQPFEQHLPLLLRPDPGSAIRFINHPKPEVSIIIPAYNCFEYTRNCLLSVAAFTSPQYEVVLVDNGSTDRTAEVFSQEESLQYIRLGQNRGFAKACNVGARWSRGKYLLFLNNDTIVQPGWLSTMLGTMKHFPDTGVVGSKLLYPKTNRIQHAGVSISDGFLPVHQYQNEPANHPEVNRSSKVAAVTGACLLTPRSLFQTLQGFDELYKNGFEDIDYCFKVSDTHHDIIYCHSSVVYHYESITEGRLNTTHDKANLKRFSQKWTTHLMELNGTNPPIKKEILPIRFGADHSLVQKLTGSIVDKKIICDSKQHRPGFCLYGPNIKVEKAFDAEVNFSVIINDILSEQSPLITLDVYDNVADKILALRTVKAFQIAQPEKKFRLTFKAKSIQTLEFRIFWHRKCRLEIRHVELSAIAPTMREKNTADGQ